MSPRYNVEASCAKGHYQDRVEVDLGQALFLMNLTIDQITPDQLPNFINTELKLRHCSQCGSPLQLDDPRLGIYRLDEAVAAPPVESKKGCSPFAIFQRRQSAKKH